METTTVCAVCGCTEKYSDGRCKDCKKRKSAEWKSQNKARVKATDAAWYKANAARKDLSVNEYRSQRPEKRRLLNKAWYDKNAELARQITKEWAKRNPGLRRAHSQNRRVCLAGADGRISSGLAARLLKLQRGLCACCKKQMGGKYHLDHIVPLALGGPNADSNIQLLCPPCNHSKGPKHPVDFMRERGFLL